MIPDGAVKTVAGQQIAAVYADGGCVTKNPSAIAGTWAYCYVDWDGKRIGCDSGILYPHDVSDAPDNRYVTNNQTEFYALLRGIESLPIGARHITCYSDSWVTLQRFFLGARTNGIRDSWLERMHDAVANMFQPWYVLLSGHPTRDQLRVGIGKGNRPVSVHNVWADEECTRLARTFGLKSGGYYAE